MGKKDKSSKSADVTSPDADLVAIREGAAVLAVQAPEAPAIQVGTASFDLDDPVFPEVLARKALGSGGFPYEEEMKRSDYEDQLRLAQIELVKLQKWTVDSGARIVVIFEGRDGAGKGGTIATFREYMNPRTAKDVALSKPSDVERGQWYFQRYVAHLPTRGEIMLFDRSWYNRAGVEPVLGFCKPEDTEMFLKEVQPFERLLVADGIILVKIWLDIGREMQLKRFHDRRHDPLKIWKLSPIDLQALSKWDDFTAARDRMLKETHTREAPWTVILGNDKRRARLNAIRALLTRVDYADKNPEAVGAIDPKILGQGRAILKSGKK